MGQDDSEPLTCDECGHVGPPGDFYGCDPDEMEGGIRLCDECFFNPKAASRADHPFCWLLQSAGRDQ
jgi:hypothetical protein